MNLVVDELERREPWVEPLESLPQGAVEGVDRAVALAGRDDPLSLGVQLHRRLGDVSPSAYLCSASATAYSCSASATAGGVLADHAVGLQLEEALSLSFDLLPQQHLEGGLGRLERVAGRLHRLDPVDDAPHGLAVDRDVELASLQLDACPTRELGHEHAHVIPDERRVGVLV